MQFGLTPYEITLIRDIIEGYADETPERILLHLKRIFAHDISPSHYIVFGRLLGELFRPINRELHFNTN